MKTTGKRKGETVEERLLRAVEQAVEWSRGERELRTTAVVPAGVPGANESETRG